ncbi:hypothetical protein KY311_03710 [Candidatus Woesearchaeota archaeon]|nr:hypothetical protein [Candidatus Woesearchaeota archaeon]
MGIETHVEDEGFRAMKPLLVAIALLGAVGWAKELCSRYVAETEFKNRPAAVATEEQRHQSNLETAASSYKIASKGPAAVYSSSAQKYKF